MGKLGLLFFFTAALSSVAVSDDGGAVQRTDSEIWNEGVDFYSSGDVTNALSAMRSLMSSRTHGSRAAEVVAKLEYDAAHGGDATDALYHLEEAAKAAQAALRSAPGDKRLNDNFSIVVAQIPELRERKRMEELLSSDGNTPAHRLLSDAVSESRKLIAGAGDMKAASTNDAVKAVAMADDFGARAEKLADKWILLKKAVSQTVTNQNELAEISSYVDALHGKTLDAARKFSDVNFDAERDLSAAEGGFTEFYKAAIPPPEAIGEVVRNLSNECANSCCECGRSWLKESADYTKAFREKFPQWAKQQEAMAQADTNKPPFTAEVQDKIKDYAEKLESLQSECLKNPTPEKKREALEKAIEIQKLMPRDKNRDKQQDGQNGKENKDSSSDKGDQGGNDRNDGSEDREDAKGQDERQKEEKKNDAQKDDGKGDGKSKAGAKAKDEEMKQIEALLKRAEERSDEHEADKKARMRSMRLPPNEKDW